MTNLPMKTALTLSIALLPAALAAAPAPHWQAVEQHGNLPPALFDAAISYSLVHGNHDTLYRFGGDNDGTLVNDFFALDLRTFTWTNVGSAQTPAARADTLMIPGPCFDCVSIVGGRGAFRTGVMFPEMQTYNARTRAWVKVPPAALGDPFAVTRAAALVVAVPAERHGHHGHDRKKDDDENGTLFYAFGGVGNTLSRFPTTPTGLHNDIAVYDPSHPDAGWHVVTTFGTKPAPRAWTTGGYDPDTHSLLVFGGYRLGPDQGPDTPGSQLFGPTNYTNDLWSLDLDTFVWTELHPLGASPSNRDNAASFFDASRGRLVTFGGEQFDALKNDLWTYSVADNRWTQVSFPPGAVIPPGRTGGVSFVRETEDEYELYIHGGSTGEGGGVLLNDLWKLTWPKE